MLSCVDALEAWPSVLPIATGTTPGITTDGMATVAATNGVTSLDHWSGLLPAWASSAPPWQVLPAWGPTRCTWP